MVYATEIKLYETLENRDNNDYYAVEVTVRIPEDDVFKERVFCNTYTKKIFNNSMHAAADGFIEGVMVACGIELEREDEDDGWVRNRYVSYQDMIKPKPGSSALW